MKHIQTLKTYPSIGEALKAIEQLEASFLKVHKRKPNVELTLAVLSSPFNQAGKRIKTSPEPAEVRIHAANKLDMAEVSWFIEQVK